MDKTASLSKELYALSYQLRSNFLQSKIVDMGLWGRIQSLTTRLGLPYSPVSFVPNKEKIKSRSKSQISSMLEEFKDMLLLSNLDVGREGVQVSFRIPPLFNTPYLTYAAVIRVRGILEVNEADIDAYPGAVPDMSDYESEGEWLNAMGETRYDFEEESEIDTDSLKEDLLIILEKFPQPSFVVKESLSITDPYEISIGAGGTVVVPFVQRSPEPGDIKTVIVNGKTEKVSSSPGLQRLVEKFLRNPSKASAYRMWVEHLRRGLYPDLTYEEIMKYKVSPWIQLDTGMRTKVRIHELLQKKAYGFLHWDKPEESLYEDPEEDAGGEFEWHEDEAWPQETELVHILGLTNLQRQQLFMWWQEAPGA